MVWGYIGVLKMKDKMPWLKDRLREVGRTPAGLARHLKIGGPRVYEMIAGRRGMQPDEIELTAAFLEWPIEQLIKHLPPEDRVLPTNVKGVTALTPGKGKKATSMLSTTRTVANNWIPVLSTTRTVENTCDLILTGQTTRYVETLPAFRGRSDIRCLYMASATMKPWRDPGDLVVFEQERPPRENDYVVVYLADGDDNETCVLVRQLLESTHPSKVSLRQHNPRRDMTIERKAVASMFRVMTWDDVIR